MATDSSLTRIMTTPQTKAVSRLENLPAELQCQLLSILDFEELRTLVHASPVFHDQYCSNRRYVLCKCLDTTLRSVAVDAYAVFLSSLPGFKEARSGGAVVPLVKGYRDRLSREYSISSEKLSEEQVINMVSFLSSVIQPLVRRFISWTWANLAKETTTRYQDQALSKTEEVRILRGFYRYHLCCNVFGTYWSCDSAGVTFYSDRVLQEFMHLVFEPWEIEEILCILAFVTNQYDEIFNHVGWKIQEDESSSSEDSESSPAQEDIESTIWWANDYASILSTSYERSFWLTGIASHGLEILHNILFKPRTQTQLISIVQENMKQVAMHEFFDRFGFIGREEQTCVRTCEQRNRGRKMQRVERLLFDGDNEPRLGEKYPPLAWTFIWQGVYSNLYGGFIPNDMRLWGYIMWDAVRLEYTGAKDVLVRQFTKEHLADPRIGLWIWYGHDNSTDPELLS